MVYPRAVPPFAIASQPFIIKLRPVVPHAEGGSSFFSRFVILRHDLAPTTVGFQVDHCHLRPAERFYNIDNTFLFNSLNDVS